MDKDKYIMDYMFTNDNNTSLIKEFSTELYLLKKIIEYAEECVNSNHANPNETYDDLLKTFSAAIVSYSKTAYDNMIIGHFYATKMLNRVIVENHVCLDVITEHKECLIPWRLHSMYGTLKAAGKEHGEILNLMKDVLKENHVDKCFIEKIEGDQNTPYIKKPYGWTYKVKNAFSFESVCKLLKENKYVDFRMYSLFSHGTSEFLKFNIASTIESVLDMISCICSNLNSLLEKYYSDSLENEYYETYSKLINEIKKEVSFT